MALAALSGAATAEAQDATARQSPPAASGASAPREARTTGLMFGVHTIAAPAITITGEDIDGSFSTTFGTGAGVMLGYGFTRAFSGFVALDVARQKTNPDDEPEGSWGLAHLAVGARVNLPLGTPSTQPYVSASVGRRGLGGHVTDLETGDEADVSLSGRMFAVGGGLEHAFSPTMAIDGGVEMSFGRFNRLDWGGDKATWQVNGSTSLRMRVGVTWRPWGSAGHTTPD
jgi:hypothetical protein